MGDINIDFNSNISSKKQLSDILSAHGFSQHVEHPTRIEGDSATLLDHAYSNIRDGRVSAACVCTNVSDHLAQRLIAPRPAAARPTAPLTVKGRVYSKNNKTSFVNALASIDWQAIVSKYKGDCTRFTEAVLCILVNLLNIHIPIKNTKVHLRSKPWIDPEVYNLKLLLFDYIQYTKDNPGNFTVGDTLAKLQIAYNQKLKTKRMDYFNSFINSNPNKNKAMWRAINMELARKPRERVDYTDLLRDTDGKPFASKQQLVDAMNREFVSAAAACGAPAPARARCRAAMAEWREASDTSIRLLPFTPAEIVLILKTAIASKNSTDIYGLSASLLKQAGCAISFILSHLFNDCMKSGIYPDGFKKVKICPLYKGKGQKSAMKSYRPISLVPGPSKCFEVGLNRRILEYWFPRNVLSECQYAYRQGRSTTDLVREVVRDVLHAREAGRHVAVICCDLSRAFDTADHSLVAEKLAHCGIRGPALNLLLSFMTERTQVVVGDNGKISSAEMDNLMGVPQGSCLSNTLFSLLLNDLPGAINGASIYMYADDVTAVVSTSSAREIEGALNSVLGQLQDWFMSNGLALNKEKTCFISFKLNGHPSQSLKVSAGDVQIQNVAHTRLLGFHLDSALVWDTHIDELCGRLGRACFALGRLARTAGRTAVRDCYFATVHSLLTYGIELWGRASEWLRVFSMQKRAIRAMAGVSADASARELFKEFHILPLPCLYLYQVAVFTYGHIHEFKRRGTNQKYSLRSNKYEDRLSSISHKLAKTERSVYYIGPSVYNRLPGTVRNAASAQIFKYRLKSWLEENNFYCN
ncbi:uncharacterized protein LOC125229081 [Leguminivora glycinivorella]|uniref:uncharacterized protein LOC125229081 n=1 Tax=Leguminivora glycinivorella TaxID=1035111 RepID=UPI00200F4986|nr:uncharacterized protein LOC125229081 [Leguminivora glycinivorella]